MKLTRALQDTVSLIEGGQVAKARRPGERFELPSVVQQTKQARKLLTVRPLIVLLGLHG